MMHSTLLYMTSVCFVMFTWVMTVQTLSPNDANVCQVTKTFLEEYITKTQQADRFKTYTWCLGLPPRCTKFFTKYKLVNKKAKRVKSKNEFICCNGYKEVEGKCIAVCKPGCEHGVCIAPGICDCHSGWRGSTCNSECSVGTWGDNCMQRCRCQNNGTCHVSTGLCSCQPGFYGPGCQYKCPEGTFGRHCSQICKCVDGHSKCDPVTGRCQCFSGYRGPLCEKDCPVGYHGMNCESDCQCQNGGHCDPVDGSCICLEGWTGPVCANPCESGWYGIHCMSQCYCYNGGTCDHISGKCSCAAGYTGSKCQVQCPYGRYGKNCSEKCLCQNNAGCDPMDGICTCTEGFMGPLCSYKVCVEGWFGPTCKSHCHCNATTSTCDPWGGQCYCNPGYVGPTCDQACDLGRFGDNCTGECDCKAEEFCSNSFGCVVIPTNEAIDGHQKTKPTEVYIGLFSAVFLLLIILISLCLALYYRRRYKRLKQTTNLMVQYRVVTTETVPPIGGFVEDGATGVSASSVDDNPAHRHFSCNKEKLRLMRDSQDEEGSEGEYEAIGAASLPVPVNGGGACYPDIPEEAPPPYTPHDDIRHKPENEDGGRAVTNLPPPYSPGHRVTRRREDENYPQRSQRSSTRNRYSSEYEECDESTQNARNLSREQSPVV